MDWKEYSYLADAFRTRFGSAPPSMLTPEGAVAYMRQALRGTSDWAGEPATPGPHRDPDRYTPNKH